MKKVVVMLALALLSICANAQSIGLREDTDEYLLLGTHFQGQNDILVSLVYFLNKTSNEELWTLGFLNFVPSQNRYGIDNGARMLIRTFSGKVFELPLNKTYKVDVDSEYIGSELFYKVYSYYDVTDAELNEIIRSGITKVRFETTRGYMDFSWTEDIFGKNIHREFNQIKGTSNFSEDF